jgi:hypothetical protein
MLETDRPGTLHRFFSRCELNIACHGIIVGDLRLPYTPILAGNSAFPPSRRETRSRAIPAKS